MLRECLVARSLLVFVSTEVQERSQDFLEGGEAKQGAKRPVIILAVQRRNLYRKPRPLLRRHNYKKILPSWV